MTKQESFLAPRQDGSAGVRESLTLPPTRREAIGGELLTDSDLKELTGAKRRLFDAMLNGKWWPRASIEKVAGREGMRRLREVRQFLEMSSRGQILKRRVGTAREWVYKMELKK